MVIKIKVKFKKADMSMILAFILMLTVFFACTIAFMYNNKVNERRSSFIDYINKQVMDLQADLEGYSTTDTYCFMYENGVRLTRAQVNAKVNNLKAQVESNIKDAFPNAETTSHASIPNMSSIFTLNDVSINITEDKPNDRDGTVHVEIVVTYTASVRAPYADATQDASGNITFSDKSNQSTNGRFKVTYKDKAKRAIENPRRYKGIS